MSTTFIVFGALGLLLAIVFHHLKSGAIRKEASYKLYSVRDDLICLVAEGKLEESNRIFEYYYKRINLLLEKAPNVGLDDAMNGFLYLQSSRDFEHSLKEAKRRAEEMLALVENEPPEVSEVISNYYSASKFMMLAHSSLVRMIYIALVKSPCKRFAKKIIPEQASRIIKAVNFADNEAHQFKDRIQQAA